MARGKLVAENRFIHQSFTFFKTLFSINKLFHIRSYVIDSDMMVAKVGSNAAGSPSITWNDASYITIMRLACRRGIETPWVRSHIEVEGASGSLSVLKGPEPVRTMASAFVYIVTSNYTNERRLIVSRFVFVTCCHR
jgi:hypothetical protein